MMKWLSTIKHVDERQARRSRRWSSTRLASRSRPASSRSSRPTRSSSRSARRPTSRCSTDVPGHRGRRRRRRGRAEHDDRPRRDLRRRRHGAGRAHGHGRRRPRQAGRAQHRRLAARADVRAAARARARRLRRRSTPGTTPTRRAPCSPQLELARRPSTFDEVVGGLDESNALFEARRCLSCGNCFSCDNCYGVCPDNAVIKLGDAGRALRDRLRLLQGLRHLRRRVPVRRDRDGARGDLSRSRHRGARLSAPHVRPRAAWSGHGTSLGAVAGPVGATGARRGARPGADSGPRRPPSCCWRVPWRWWRSPAR